MSKLIHLSVFKSMALLWCRLRLHLFIILVAILQMSGVCKWVYWIIHVLIDASITDVHIYFLILISCIVSTNWSWIVYSYARKRIIVIIFLCIWGFFKLHTLLWSQILRLQSLDWRIKCWSGDWAALRIDLIR